MQTRNRLGGVGSYNSKLLPASSQESLHVCTLYNRLATALLQYEGLWLQRWRASTDAGRDCLRATLLVQEAGGGADQPSVVRVNCHHRYVRAGRGGEGDQSSMVGVNCIAGVCD